MSADLKKLSEELISCSGQIATGINEAAWHDWLENVAAPTVNEAAASLASKDEEIRRMRKALSEIADAKPEPVADGFVQGPRALWNWAQNRARKTLQGDADVSR